MNEELDPLEAELRNLRPRPPSPDLPRRVGERLAAAPAPPARRTWPRRLALAAGLAACLAVALLAWRPGKHDDRPGAGRQGPPPVVEPPESLPTFGAYRRALDESPEALDALLEEQAARPTDLGLPPDRLPSYLSRSDPFARRGELP